MWNSYLLAPVVACLLTSSAQALTLEPRRAPITQAVTKETAQFFPAQKSERVKQRYSSFTVGPMTVNNGMQDFEDYATPPCTDCLITWARAGLEYENGTEANANTNLWLHHVVFTNLGRKSAVCPDQGYGDDFFASGNERTPIDICVNGTDQAGYYIAPTDTLGFLIELMNMEMENQTAVLTMTWEYIPSVPAGFDQVTALWLDIGGCAGDSDMPAKDTTFQYTSPPWKSDLTGRITFAAGHLHDGGTHLTVKKNNTVECNCQAAYGQSAAYFNNGDMGTSSMPGMTMTKREPASMSMSMSMSMPTSEMSKTKTKTAMPASTSMPGMSMGGNDTVHISSITTCSNFASVNIDDEWTITAYYDPAEHALMTNTNGSLAPIMGISILYVAPNNLTLTKAASSGTTSGSASGTAAASTSTNGALKSLHAELAHVLGWAGVLAMALFGA